METMITLDLDRVRCPNNQCMRKHPVRLDPGCHPGAPVELFYDDGELTVVCHECEKPFAKIAVARAN